MSPESPMVLSPVSRVGVVPAGLTATSERQRHTHTQSVRVMYIHMNGK